MALAIPYYILSQGIYSGIITGISTMTLGVCKIIGSIYSHKNPDLTEKLDKIDIEYNLNLLCAVLKLHDKPINNDIILDSSKGNITFTIVNMYNIKSDDPLEISLGYIAQSIENIFNILTEIEQLVAYHETKWFKSWRSMGIKKHLNKLEMEIIILKKRFSDFVKICSICKHNNNVSAFTKNICRDTYSHYKQNDMNTKITLEQILD
jgi:hypothetical protein